VERYATMGLRVLCAGEEAVVDPARFTLEGRAVRKLRQSVHRVKRHGWEITAFDGRDIDRRLEAEIDALERSWRATKSRIIGFAMGMGVSEGGVGADDLCLLGRAPDGALRAVMRFISHRGKLSLDTMRRVGETPNGLNDALLCRALEIARERLIPEVSLNYAGLAHLVRNPPPGNALTRRTLRLGIRLLGRHFQMERLVRFNDKFDPSWRPRYLVYESRLSLPRTVHAVLEAEGYIAPRRRRPGGRDRVTDGLGHAWGQPLPRGQQPAARPEGHVGR
jgi:lysyl-tRNA synthetase, class II